MKIAKNILLRFVLRVKFLIVVKETILNNPEIRQYTFEIKNGISKKKVFLNFGVHARELISSEAGFHFLHRLCREEEGSFLKNLQIRLILVANPSGRMKVENEGKFCLRTNKNGI